VDIIEVKPRLALLVSPDVLDFTYIKVHSIRENAEASCFSDQHCADILID
jgi:hypothetical protein